MAYQPALERRGAGRGAAALALGRGPSPATSAARPALPRRRARRARQLSGASGSTSGRAWGRGDPRRSAAVRRPSSTSTEPNCSRTEARTVRSARRGSRSTSGVPAGQEDVAGRAGGDRVVGVLVLPLPPGSRPGHERRVAVRAAPAGRVGEGLHEQAGALHRREAPDCQRDGRARQDLDVPIARVAHGPLSPPPAASRAARRRGGGASGRRGRLARRERLRLEAVGAHDAALGRQVEEPRRRARSGRATGALRLAAARPSRRRRPSQAAAWGQPGHPAAISSSMRSSVPWRWPEDRHAGGDARRRLVQRREVVQVQDVGCGGARVPQRAPRPRRGARRPRRRPPRRRVRRPDGPRRTGCIGRRRGRSPRGGRPARARTRERRRGPGAIPRRPSRPSRGPAGVGQRAGHVRRAAAREEHEAADDAHPRSSTGWRGRVTPGPAAAVHCGEEERGGRGRRREGAAAGGHGVGLQAGSAPAAPGEEVVTEDLR